MLYYWQSPSLSRFLGVLCLFTCYVLFGQGTIFKMASMISPVDLMPSGIEHGNGVMVAITTLFTFLATVAVILRFISRRISVTVKWDDWFSLIALIFAYGCFIVTLLDATIAHGGYDIEYYSAATLEKYLEVRYWFYLFTTVIVLMKFWFVQITLAENVLYVASISFSKAAVLLLYHRIFKIQKSFRVASWVVGFLIGSYFITSQCLLIFAYNPTEAQWKPWLPHSANFNVIASWMVMSSINMVVDFLILCLPQPVVWRLKMNLKKKVLLSGLFCFGIVWVLNTILHSKVQKARLTLEDLVSVLRTWCILSVSQTSTSIILQVCHGCNEALKLAANLHFSKSHWGQHCHLAKCRVELECHRHLPSNISKPDQPLAQRPS